MFFLVLFLKNTSLKIQRKLKIEETFFYNIKKENKLNKDYLNSFFESEKYELPNDFQGDLDELPFPDWKSYLINIL